MLRILFGTRGLVIAALCLSLTAILYMKRDSLFGQSAPLLAEKIKKGEILNDTKGVLPKELSSAIRAKVAPLLAIPATNENVGLRELIDANQVLRQSILDGPRTRQRALLADAKIMALQRRAVQLGIKLTPAMSEALEQSRHDLKLLASSPDATERSSHHPSVAFKDEFKLSVPAGSRSRSVSGMSALAASVQSGSTSPFVTMNSARGAPKVRSALLPATQSSRSTQTCTDSDPTDPISGQSHRRFYLHCLPAGIRDHMPRLPPPVLAVSHPMASHFEIGT